MSRLVHALAFVAALLFSDLITAPAAQAGGYYRADCYRAGAGYHRHCDRYRYHAYRGYWLGYGGYPVARWGGAGYRPADEVRYDSYFARYAPAYYDDGCYVRHHRKHRHHHVRCY